MYSSRDTHITMATTTAWSASFEDSAVTAIQNWMNDPFDPHSIASTRTSAYGKATVMKFLDVLLAWGDWYYAQYTAEFVSQAEQLYVFAEMILGPSPRCCAFPMQTSAVQTPLRMHLSKTSMRSRTC